MYIFVTVIIWFVNGTSHTYIYTVNTPTEFGGQWAERTRPLIEEVEGDNPTKTEMATVEVIEDLKLHSYIVWVTSLAKPHNQLVKMAGKKLCLMPKPVVKERLKDYRAGRESWVYFRPSNCGSSFTTVTKTEISISHVSVYYQLVQL